MRDDLGGYYWLPTPTPDGISWDVLTCHDLGHSDDSGHAEIWPTAIARLAAAWPVAPTTLARRLRGRFAGLPRGRVSGAGRRVYLNHGGDAPRPDGLAIVRGRFGLGRAGVGLVVALDPHERMLRGDPEALQRALGVDLGLRGC